MGKRKEEKTEGKDRRDGKGERKGSTTMSPVSSMYFDH